MPDFYHYALLAVTGACLGSFANVVALRHIAGGDWVRAPSSCFACQRRLRFSENLPIIGWLRHGGRCACGDRRLPPRYLGVELALGALLPLAFWRLGADDFPAAVPFILLLSIIFLTDLEAFIIPNRASLGGAVLGLVFAALDAPGLPDLKQALLGGLCGFALIYGINALYRLWRHRDGMGFGDVKLMVMLGVWLGPTSLLPILFAASMAGAVFRIAMILAQQNRQETGPAQVPFGCFLVPAALGWLLFVPHALAA